jgi:hypothetical protein
MPECRREAGFEGLMKRQDLRAGRGASSGAELNHAAIYSQARRHAFPGCVACENRRGFERKANSRLTAHSFIRRFDAARLGGGSSCVDGFGKEGRQYYGEGRVRLRGWNIMRLATFPCACDY